MIHLSHPIILASHNAHKISEIQLAFQPLQLKVTAPPEPFDVEEDADSFKGNSLKKALEHARHWHCAAMGDDSGLEVDALNGAPGIYSARFAGKSGNEATPANNALLLEKLKNIPDPKRTAHFTCAICLVVVDPADIECFSKIKNPHIKIAEDYAAICVEGHSYGHILHQAAGTCGFGYDPLFFSDDLQKTFAEASSEEKLSVSHRGRAISALIDILKRF